MEKLTTKNTTRKQKKISKNQTVIQDKKYLVQATFSVSCPTRNTNTFKTFSTIQTHRIYILFYLFFFFFEILIFWFLLSKCSFTLSFVPIWKIEKIVIHSRFTLNFSFFFCFLFFFSAQNYSFFFSFLQLWTNFEKKTNFKFFLFKKENIIHFV